MASPFSHRIETLLQELPRAMAIAGVPGLVMTLIEDGQPGPTYAYGVKSTATKAPVTTETIFQAASLSKPLFAYGALRLHMAQDLDLDQPLYAYLPSPDLETDPQLQTITARQVLSHSSGLQNWRFALTDTLQLAFPPGQRFAYSGEGYFYLQRVIEELTGKSIETYLQECVLQPLGMRHSTYLWYPEAEQHIATGHQDRDQTVESWNARWGSRMLALAAQGEKPLAAWRYADVKQALPALHPDLPPLPNNMIPNVAGSLLTTGPDYAQFMSLMLATPAPNHQQAAAIRQMMLTSQIPLNSALSWGLGWGLETEANQTYFWQWGQNGVFENFAIGNPSIQSGLVILTNSSSGLKLCAWLVRGLTGHEHAAFLWL